MEYSVNQPGTPKVIKHWDDGESYELTKQTAVAFEGPCRVVAAADDFFGGSDSKSYRGRVLVNPTWRQLYGEAKRSQRKTRDFHHSFFEGAYVSKVDENGVKVLYLLLGS